MTDMTASEIWRGSPVSDAHQPNPREIVDYLTGLELLAGADGGLSTSQIAKIIANKAEVQDLLDEVSARQSNDMYFSQKLDAEVAARVAGDEARSEGAFFAGHWVPSTGAFPVVRAQGGAVQNGDWFRIPKGESGIVDGFNYTEGMRINALVASPSASTYPGSWVRDETPGDLVPIYAQLDAGVFRVAQLGLDITGATDVTAQIQPLIGRYSEIVWPIGVFNVALDINAKVKFRGAGRGLTKLSSASKSAAVTLDINADFDFSDMTIEANLENSGGMTIKHDGSYRLDGRDFHLIGCNHDLGRSPGSMGYLRNFECTNGAQSDGALGAVCHSAQMTFENFLFNGGRAVEANASLFKFGEINCLDTCVHMPEGEYKNLQDGIYPLTGHDGCAKFHAVKMYSANGTGVTCGNAAHPSFTGGCEIEAEGDGFYGRSDSTIKKSEDTKFKSRNGNAIAISLGNGLVPPKTGISRVSGGSIECQAAASVKKSISIPTTTDVDPSIGKLILTDDVQIIDGTARISNANSTYLVFEPIAGQGYVNAIQATEDDQTLRFKNLPGDAQKITIQPVGGSRTGLVLSNIDSATGLPHEPGMRVIIKMVTFGSTVTFVSPTLSTDANRMYFADNGATFVCDYNIQYEFELDGSTWRQVG